MSKESLRALLAGLRAELAETPDLDSRMRAELHDLTEELEAALDFPARGATGAERPLPDRLADRVRELEATHPKLSSTIGNLVDTLAFYGL
jgi:uncharacterized protein DUF4404